jgi:tRNA-specific 2-thiouridylase
VPDDDYRRFLDRRIGASAPGPIVTVRGELIGHHAGLTRYTVGQRKGLGIAAPRPYYVVKIDVAKNTLVVGHDGESATDTLSAGEVVWGAIAPPGEPFECAVQIRYRSRAVPCAVRASEDAFSLRLHEPCRGVTPGQWAVLYDERDRVLAAGIIQ